MGFPWSSRYECRLESRADQHNNPSSASSGERWWKRLGSASAEQSVAGVIQGETGSNLSNKLDDYLKLDWRHNVHARIDSRIHDCMHAYK